MIKSSQGVFVYLKNGSQLIFLVKVKINIAFIAALAELFHEPGLMRQRERELACPVRIVVY